MVKTNVKQMVQLWLDQAKEKGYDGITLYDEDVEPDLEIVMSNFRVDRIQHKDCYGESIYYIVSEKK